MITSILSALSHFIIAVITTGGYAGVFVLMLLQSLNIPIPSEVVMPFSGFLAHEGIFNFWILVAVGVLANLCGSLVSYKFAVRLIRNGWRARYPIIRFLLNDASVAFAEDWFRIYGTFGVFWGRLLPVVNTFISFPAGLARMPLKKFMALTLGGALVWNFFLAGVGYKLGQNWTMLEGYFRQFDYLILTVILIGIAVWVWQHFSNHTDKASLS